MGRPGDVLGGRYRLLAPLAAGGMARVWRAEHVSTGLALAIKIIDPAISSVEFNLARFLREAKTLKSLDSPHLVKVLDYGADADTAFLVMELLTGETLGSRLVQRGHLTFAELQPILRDVCSAMSLVHERDLVHRDLKPENIFLCATRSGVGAKVVDFGIAKPVHETTAGFRTHTGYVLGTPAYMSPEQCRGLRDVDRRSDLWSLGVIAYECLVGREPFRAETLAELLLQICMDPPPVPSAHCSVALPVGFDAWFAKAVARERADRFQSSDELAAAFSALQPASTRREPLAPPAPAAESVRRPEFRRITARKLEAERSTPFGLGVVVRRKLEPRVKWSVAAALALLIGMGAWQLFRLTLAPRPTSAEIEALRPSATPARAPSSTPGTQGLTEGSRTPAAEHDRSPPPVSTPAPASSPPPAEPPTPAALSATPPRPAPLPAAPPPAAPTPPRRRAPATDIRTSR
jgi:eukaryotic-like serine/threonine-protein kinase